MMRIKTTLSFLAILGLSIPAYGLTSDSTAIGLSAKKIEAPSQTRDVFAVEGKLKKIDGEFFIVEHSMSGKQLRIHVDKETVFLSDSKKPGDWVRAQVNINSGHALTIR